MKNELVSIIITAFNEEKYIERAISSALNQSYDRIEVIVIDDGSNDKTLSSTVPVCPPPSGNGQGVGCELCNIQVPGDSLAARLRHPFRYSQYL